MKIRLIAGAVTAVALAFVGLTIPTAAFAAGTSTVVVQLVQPSGKPLDVAGRAVDLYAAHSGGAVYSRNQETDSTGKATFTDAPVGISLDAEANSDSGYLNHIKTGVKAATGKTVTVKVTSTKGAAISGTVTEGVTTTPLPGGDVVLLNSSGRQQAAAPINASGQFTFVSVASGSYRVQYNSRKYDSSSDSARQFSWSYWNGSASSTLAWASAKILKVHQQTASSAASVVSGLDGKVYAGNSLSATVSYWAPESSHAGTPVEFVGAHAADSFVTTLDSAGDLDTTPLNPGKYRIAIVGDHDPIFGVTPIYWYVTDTSGPTTNQSKASWVTIDVAHKHIDFVPAKGNFA